MRIKRSSLVPFTIGIFAVGLIAYLFSVGGLLGPLGGGPACNATSTPNLTIRRTDTLPDFTSHITPPVAGVKAMNFRITNHSASTTYEFRFFFVFPGIYSTHDPNRVTNLRIYNATTLVGRGDSLASSTVSVNPLIYIRPLTSMDFSLRADVATTTISSSSEDRLQFAIGQIYASPAGNPRIIEQVFKERDGVPLMHPAILDESLESAVFTVP